MPKKDTDNRFAVRDNTRTSNIYNVGYVRNNVPLRNNSDVRLDDNVFGFMPIIGDVLQGLQAYDDLQNQKYLDAAIGIGLLAAPNIIEKPIKAATRGIRKILHGKDLTNRISRALQNIPDEVTKDVVVSPGLKERLLGEGVNPSILTDDNLKKLTYGRVDALQKSVNEAPGRFVYRAEPEDDGWVGYIMMEPGYPSPRPGKYPNGYIGYIQSRPSVDGKETGVGFVKNATRGTQNPVHGVSETGYNALIKENGSVISGEQLENPEITTRIWKKYSDKEKVGDYGAWTPVEDVSKHSFGHDVYRLTKPTYDVPIKYGDVFSAYSISPEGKFLVDFTKDAYHADGGKIYFKRGGRRNNILLVDPVGYSGGGKSGGRESVTSAVDPAELKMRQRYAESGFRDNLTSPAGAIGRYQVMPITYKEYIQRTGKTGDLMDPMFNEGLRDWYMDENLPKYEAVKRGNPSDIVREYRKYAAYNMGPVGLNRALTKAVNNGIDIDNTTDWLDYLPKETRDYVNFIVGGEDIPDTSKTTALYDAAKQKYGIFSDGGDIHIKPSHRGRLTELKKRTGKTETELYNDGNPDHKKMVVFARNARKWHSDGGYINQAINDGKVDLILAAINNIKKRRK